MTIDTDGREVIFVPYEEGSGKRFRGYNLPPSARRWDKQRRIYYVLHMNQKIDVQRKCDTDNDRAKNKQLEELLK